MKQAEILITVGTRPEIIKMAPVIREIEKNENMTITLIHTNQHYDQNLSEDFFRILDLPSPDVNLNVESGSHGRQTADAIIGIEERIKKSASDIILAQGDTNAVLSTAIAASKLQINFGHIEAGIRSYDRTMPEEINRVLADHAADLRFAPSVIAKENLLKEGITNRVYVTGNTIVDACLKHAPIAEEKSDIQHELDINKGEYIVSTIHRPNNTENEERLLEIVTSLDNLRIPVVFPAHPRTQKRLEEMGFSPSDHLQITKPLDYLDFLCLCKNAKVIVTDSGGVQEEASILQVPCLTVRPNTERPETVNKGVNELIEPSKLEIRIRDLVSDEKSRQAMTGHPHIYGDGKAGKEIMDVISDIVL